MEAVVVRLQPQGIREFTNGLIGVTCFNQQRRVL
jgi:hypothetical protein